MLLLVFGINAFHRAEIEDLKVAPLLKKYQEPSHKTVKYLIGVKSIISGACVVRTNLVNLIQNIEPEKIFIVAPVIYQNAEQKLKDEFEKSIYDKFQFFYFAKDNERTHEGEVIPGIGGNVEERLGFEGQDRKNEYIPEIVKLRRSQFLHQALASRAYKTTSKSAKILWKTQFILIECPRLARLFNSEQTQKPYENVMLLVPQGVRQKSLIQKSKSL